MSSTPSRPMPSSASAASSPAHSRTLTSSSASSFPPTNTSAPATITPDSLLTAHASDQDPKLAALEHAVSERNTLSSQNAQLWKLIEKQRSGYNQILKELERVRSERDGYKAKLTAVIGGTPRSRKDTLNGDRENVDLDSHTPRAHQDISSYPSFQSNSTAAPSKQPKSSLAPLLVPPRAESLPIPASAIGSATAENAPFSHAAKYTGAPSTAPAPHTPPHPHRHSPLVSPPQTAVYTPQTAPAGFSQPPSSLSRGHVPTSSASTITPEIQPTLQIIAPPVSESSPVSTSPQQGSNSMLAALNDSRSQPLSRDSRISLPDEARHYIANMGESPAPSPKVDAFAPRALPSAPSTASAPSKSEFLDLEDAEDDEDDEDDDVNRNISDDEDNAGESEVKATVGPPTQPLYAPRRPQPTAASDFPLPPNGGGAGPSEAVSQGSTNGQGSSPYPSPSIQQQVQQQRALAQMQQQQQQYGNQQQYASSPSQYQPAAPPNEALPPLQPLRPQGPSTVPASFRALPLLSSDLPSTSVTVSHSFVRPNDRGKEVLSFIVYVDPGHNKEGWKVEKLYSDVIALDQRVRNSVGKTVGKKMVTLPEGKLWKDHAPAKVDQRKAILETYLQALVNLPVKNNDEVVAFFTSDIIRDYKQPVMQAGHKEGYLTKRGKNFGGWKTRFFVLQGPVLEYYDCRGGAHLGSITITGAQIGRQQRSEKPATDEEKEYRHAFLIVEAKKGPGGGHPRHVLCAESDVERDSWVEILVRYFTGNYSEEPVTYGQPYSSSSNGYPNGAPPQARPSADVTSSYRSASPARSLDYSPVERPSASSTDAGQTTPRKVTEQRQQPSSLPDSSPLASAAAVNSEVPYQRANSEQGHYPDMVNGTPRRRQHSPEHHRREKGFQPTLNTVASSPVTATAPQQQERPPSPDSKVKISGPMNGGPIPAGYKFGGKDTPPAAEPPTPASANDRREKAKSRSFWGFGRPGAGGEKVDKAASHVVTYTHRAVFGVSLDESLDVAQIAHLPAIVFRCIQYLEAKKADQEEGIYRLSGSSAVIKSLKDRFNMEGDIDLVGSDEYWDPHAIAGLLKSFLRELPASILTHNLHMRFLSVVDFVDPQERIKELAALIEALPFPNYSLLRALTAHLILIVQNATVNKMTMRNVGIVFSPTLGIPAPLFSLMLTEFNRVFKVDEEDTKSEQQASPEADDGADRRNSRQYTSGAADQMLGLSGRKLQASDDAPSDDDSIQYESGTETTEDNATAESSSSSPAPMETPNPGLKPSKATSMANAKGLSAAVLGPVCFFLGVLFICFNIDYRVLWVPLSDETVQDGFQFYTTFYNAPPAIKALLHGMIGVVLIGLLSKLHAWDDSAMFFDGSCIAVVVFGIAVYATVVIPMLRTIVTPLESETRTDRIDAMTILSAANIIIMACLGLVLLLQAGQEYARRVDAKERAALQAEEKKTHKVE
ncbi:hypothetical protein MKEN_00880200 [Mycena kentingensis (nom. inval.)]|nr:hypothetical protein MKEN_00880200 [Mycena kentingensis (nom. inval.)]